MSRTTALVKRTLQTHLQASQQLRCFAATSITPPNTKSSSATNPNEFNRPNEALRNWNRTGEEPEVSNQ